MKKRLWTSEKNLQIVMQGIKGRAVSEICNEHRIGQSQYYLWRDQFLQNAGKVFEMPQKAQQQTRLERENEKLKAMVSELTMELKKTIGKPSSLPFLLQNRCGQIAAQADSSSQSGASILWLSKNLGVPSICRRIVHQQETHLPAFERKQFARRARQPSFGKTDEQYQKAATGASESVVGH